ncbi:MAG: transposase [Anaeromyxobacteraceae bacterium]
MQKRAPEPAQQALALPARGGKRPGAGRPSSRERSAVPHVERDDVRPYQPVHVTLRMADAVWNLRSERSFAVIHAALTAARRRPDARVVHFSVQGNHIHLIVEASGTAALSNAVRALAIMLARRLNRMMGRSGPVFEGRFHSHVLRTPAEVRNALRYVVGNFASHAARRNEPMRQGWVDPFSSAAGKTPRSAQVAMFPEPPVRPAKTWLLRQGDRPRTAALPSSGNEGHVV